MRDFFRDPIGWGILLAIAIIVMIVIATCSHKKQRQELIQRNQVEVVELVAAFPNRNDQPVTVTLPVPKDCLAFNLTSTFKPSAPDLIHLSCTRSQGGFHVANYRIVGFDLRDGLLERQLVINFVDPETLDG